MSIQSLSNLRKFVLIAILVTFVSSTSFGDPPLRVIIDTDPAVGDSDPDDGTAIIYAFQSPELCTIEGITYGYGNFGHQIPDPKPDGTRGADRMLDYYLLQLNKMLEVLHEDGAIENDPNLRRGHKESETWDNNEAHPQTGASDFIRETVRDNPGHITVVALGTLTNIATAMANYPNGQPSDPNGFMRDCKELWIIGGAIILKTGLQTGNVIDCDSGCSFLSAEWNIWRDKKAAEYVLRHAITDPISGAPKIKLVPLNATMRWLIKNTDIEEVKKSKTRIANYLDFPLRWWISEVNPWDHRQLEDIENLKIGFARSTNSLRDLIPTFIPAFPPYDTIGMALALEPDIATSQENHKVYVSLYPLNAGQTIEDDTLSDREEVHVIYDYDTPQMTSRIISRWMETRHHNPPQNKKFIECSDAAYVVKYYDLFTMDYQYEEPRNVSLDATEYRILPTDPLPIYTDYFYHLPVGLAPYYSVTYNGMYWGRLIFDVNLPDDVSVTEVKLHIYCDKKKDWFDTGHRASLYRCNPDESDPAVIWASASPANAYCSDTHIGTLQAWRTVNLGVKGVEDLQNVVPIGQFAILLAEDDDDHPCAWFDTSKDWKAYLEVDYDSGGTIGSLIVTINPSEVRGSARWRLTNGPDTSWKVSGDVISSLSPGDYTLQFNEVSDWQKPEDRVVTISEGSNSESGTYSATIDLYEPDNTHTQANWIYDDVPQTHSISPVGDVDWVKFSLGSESEVVIETSGAAGDTRVCLYNSSLTELECNDDGGTGLFSRIDRVCGTDALGAGTYYVKIEEYENNGQIISYTVNLSVTACSSGNHDPQLSNGSVDPDSGDTNVDFYWYVHYYDEDGGVPPIREVRIDSTSHTMRLYSGTFSDGTYVFGPMRLSEGFHDYYFYFRDGSGSEVRLPDTGKYPGPSVGSSGGQPDLVVTDSIAPTNDQWLPFNSIPVGGSKIATVTLSNQGQGALTVQGIPSPSQPGIWVGDNGSGDSAVYSIAFPDDPDGNGEFVLQPGENQRVVVTFLPTEIRNYKDAWLKINSNDPDYPDGFFISLDGAGIDSSFSDIIMVGAYHDHAGSSLSSAGDVNGDGYDDLLIGAPDADIGTGLKVGRAYLIYGGPNLDTSIDLLSQANFIMEGVINYDNLGNCVSSGDFNGDGFSDIAIVGGLRAYIVYGKSDLSGTISSNNADLVLEGVDRPLSLSGDLNGDGYNDLIIGYRIIMGRANLTGTLNVQTNSDVTINGVGGAVATHAGDVDGDGLCDIIIDGGSPSGEGGAYLFLGRHTWVNSLNATDANCHLQAVGYDYYIGSDLAGMGDINGDGYDDLLIGAMAASSSVKGKVYIVYGKSTWPNSMLVTNSDVIISGANTDDCFGRVVDGTGDFNADGYSDILLGAPYSDINGNNSGEAYLIYGRGNLSSTLTMPSNADRHWTGAALTRLGSATTFAGDIDRDGRADMAISAPSAASSAGETYLIRGGTTTPVTPPRLKPDLSILAISGDTLISPDNSLNLNVSVENIGPGPAHSYKIACYLSEDQNIEKDSDTLLGYIPMGRLGAGETDNGHMLTNSPNVSDGLYFIAILVDVMNENAEGDETNNLGTIPIGMDGRPPYVENCFVGGASEQQVDELTVLFDSPVSVDVDDVTVTHSTSAELIPFILEYSDCTLTLYFKQSLSQGKYDLRLNAAGISDSAGNPLDGNGDGVGGDDYSFTFSVTIGDFHPADTNSDWVISISEIISCINKWAAGEISISDVVKGINLWAAGHYYWDSSEQKFKPGTQP
jgi:inosine-uridine nucleoside N-ribohydrolase